MGHARAGIGLSTQPASSTPAFRSLTKDRGEGQLPTSTYYAPSGRIAPSCSSATFPKAHLSPPRRLCVLSASALDFVFVRSSLSAVDCRLSASSFPLTPVFLPLARPALNMTIFYLLPTTGGRVPGRVPPGPTKSSELLAKPNPPDRSNHMQRPRPIAPQPPRCENHHIAGIRNIRPLPGV
jgi:hypothetical protein